MKRWNANKILWISIVFAVMMGVYLTLMPVTARAATHTGYCGDLDVNGGTDVMWSLDDETGELTISGSGDIRFAFSVLTLEMDYPTSVTSAVIHEGVTNVSVFTFSRAQSLKSVTIPNSVTDISPGAFQNCKSLESINIPGAVTTIGDGTFQGCTSLQSVNFPDSLTSIGSYAFWNCENLQSINIPDSVTTIGANTFQNCKSLESINIPEGVTTIGANTFLDCASLQSVTLPDSLTTIGANAFDECRSLQSVTIPDSVTSIGSNAFSNCQSLQSANIPNGITAIHDNTFSFCQSLQSITIPDSVITIGQRAFAFCLTMQDTVIPDSVTTIGKYAFQDCNGFQSVTIPDSVTSIDNGTFGYCVNLQNVTIPGSVTSIGDDTFVDCVNLQSVTIPGSVTSIGLYAFDGCVRLQSVTFAGESPPATIGKNAFGYLGPNSPNRIVYYPQGAYVAYDNIIQHFPSDWTCYPPSLVSAETSADGTQVFLEFDKPLNAASLDPSHFTVNNGAANAVTDIAIDGGDPLVVRLTLTTPIADDDDVTIAYAAGSATASDSGVLATFDAQLVANRVPAPYTPVIVIDGQPAATTTLTAGSINGSLQVTVSPPPGATLSYEWYSCDDANGSNAVSTGFDSDTFIISTSLPPGTYYYYCTISSDDGAADVNSNIAMVIVHPPTPPVPSTPTPTSSNTIHTTNPISPIAIDYALTVNGSYAETTGAGRYRPGNTVTIRAGSRPDHLFAGWSSTASGVVFANATSATTTFTMPAQNVDVTANWVYNGIDNTRASGAENGFVSVFVVSGVYNPTTATTPPTPSTSTTLSTTTTLSSPPVATPQHSKQPTMAQRDETAAVDENGHATIAIDEAQIEMLIDRATWDAAQKGKSNDGIGVQQNIRFDDSGKSFCATLTQAALDLLQKEGVKRFDINTPLIRFSLDAEAIKEVHAQTAGDVTFCATPVANLSDAASECIGDRPVFDIAIRYHQDGNTQYVTDLKKGTVTLGIAYQPASGEKIGNLYGVYVDASGAPQLLTHSSYENGNVILRRNHLSIYGVGYKADVPDFRDTANHWAKANIDFVVGRGLLSGISAMEFAPDTAITRTEFMAALDKLANPDAHGTSETDNRSFSLTNVFTRADMAVVLADYAKTIGYALPIARQAITFADDTEISSVAKDAVQALQQAGVISGKENNLFAPQRDVTRAEAATILRRFIALTIDEGTARDWVQNDAGQWQYINSSGKAVASNWVEAGAAKYYFDDYGVRVSGTWLAIGGKWYYFQADGKLATHTTIDGYTVGADGARYD